MILKKEFYATPWGPAQTKEEIAPGIIKVTTASHGGILLDEARQAEFKKVFPSFCPFCCEGAFEEDCDWSMVALAFPQFFPNDQEAAKLTVINQYPTQYEYHFKTTVTAKQSRQRAEEKFYHENIGAWIVCTAWGDWYNSPEYGQISKGFCLVCARRLLNEEGERGNEEKFYILSTAEYNASRENSFVIRGHAEAVRV
jgi:hypothetical protein